MNTAEALNILRQHNAWRRGDDESIEQVEPKLVGQAIDFALSALSAASAEQQPENNEDLADTVSKAMRRSFTLGQTYWQQADSESISQHKRADETQRKFDQLVDDTRNAILSAPQASQPIAKENAVQQAQQWSMEAKTQRSIVLGILRALGLPENDWEAERLVLDHVAQLKASQPVSALTDDLLRIARKLESDGDEYGCAADIRSLLSATSQPSEVIRNKALNGVLDKAHDIIFQARESIGSGGCGKQAQYERGIISPYLDHIEDELRALRQQAPAQTAPQQVTLKEVPAKPRPYGYAVEANDGHITFFKTYPRAFDDPKWEGLMKVHTLYTEQTAPVVPDTDLLKRVTDVAVMLYSEWENGVPCYEDPDDSAGYLGNAFKLDDGADDRCVRIITEAEAYLSAAQQKKEGE